MQESTAPIFIGGGRFLMPSGYGLRAGDSCSLTQCQIGLIYGFSGSSWLVGV